MFEKHRKVPVKNMTISVEVKSALNPVIFLFLLSGIDLTKSKRKWHVLLASLYFHVMCLGIIIFKTVCLIQHFHWSLLVTMTMKVTSLVMWWFVFTRRENFAALIEELESINEELNYADYKKIKKLSITASACAVILLCVQPIVLSLRYIIPSGVGITCTLLQFSEDDAWSLVVVLFHEFVSVYVNVCITFAVSVFYAMYCYTFSKCILEKKRPKTQTLLLYQNVLSIFKDIEDDFSAIIFIIFVHFLASLFKDMVVLVFVFKSGKYTTVYAYLIDFTLNAILAMIVVLSAGSLQQKANSLRETLFRLSEDVPGQSCLSARFIRILEERKHLQLTGWGMFTLKKPLLLTVVAWLITYGVIIFQLSD